MTTEADWRPSCEPEEKLWLVTSERCRGRQRDAQGNQEYRWTYVSRTGVRCMICYRLVSE